MTTKEKIEANRKNATRSTGPRTAAGKSRSALNSTKHGFLGKFLLMEDENPKEFDEFAEKTRAVLKPEGAVESALVDRWVKDRWRLNRMDTAETTLLDCQPFWDDLSIFDLMDILKQLNDESRRRFDELPVIAKLLASKPDETRNDSMGFKTPDASSPKEVLTSLTATMGLGLSSLEILVTKQLDERFRNAKTDDEKAHRMQERTETDRANGDHGRLSTKATINSLARSFARNRETLVLLLRYRTGSNGRTRTRFTSFNASKPPARAKLSLLRS
jgi:hypothetical protein